MIVEIDDFDEVPRHQLEVTDVWETELGGIIKTGSWKGTYGEPEYKMIMRIVE